MMYDNDGDNPDALYVALGQSLNEADVRIQYGWTYCKTQNYSSLDFIKVNTHTHVFELLKPLTSSFAIMTKAKALLRIINWI